MLQVNYTPRIAHALKPAFEGDRRVIEREIKAGQSRVYRAQTAPLYLVIRFEGTEMVIVAAAGRHLQQAQGEIISFAEQYDMKSLRFHTIDPNRLRKGMAGLPIYQVAVKSRFLKPDQYIFRMEL